MNKPTANLLIVEDDPVLVSALARTIERMMPACRVLMARSNAEAQIYLSEHPIDLFLLDVHLPDGNGIDFLCDVLTVNPLSRAMVMTSSPTPELRARCEELGVVELWSKPINPAQLFDIISQELRLLEGRRAPVPTPTELRLVMAQHEKQTTCNGNGRVIARLTPAYGITVSAAKTG